jgi:hypothetical protein
LFFLLNTMIVSYYWHNFLLIIYLV